MNSVRLQVIMGLILAICVVILGRVFFLSIKSNTYYEELSKQNYIKRIYEPSIRGVIKDRNGITLAINEMGFSLSIEPHLSIKKNHSKLDEIINLISQNFPQLDAKKILMSYKQEDSHYNHDFIKVVDYIPYNDFVAKYSIFNRIKEIDIKTSYKRIYPYKEVAAHVLGYVGKSSKADIKADEITRHSGFVGKSGLEKYYNSLLQGTLGYTDIKVNAYNEEVDILEVKQPSLNNDLQTTIDIKLQEHIHNLFKDMSGAAVVMDNFTGEILAAGSFPEFDNNIFANGIALEDWEKIKNDLNHPFTNKLVNGLYPPGSVVKMGVALSFLENGIPEDFSIYCDGGLKVGNRRFRCWKPEGHATTGFVKAIRESCDVFFYTGSTRIGVNRVANTLSKLGFGQLSGIDQPNEFMGVNPTQEWKIQKYKKPWYIGETVVSSIGQGFFLVTPVQVARYTGAVATKKLMTPHFIKDAQTQKYEKNIVIQDSHLNIIKSGMYDVCNAPGGTAYKFINSKVKLGGKTGTAQVISIPQEEKARMKESQLQYYQRSHAWLTTIGPFSNPRYVVTILVEHGGHGGSAAGNIVGSIFDKLVELKYIQ